MMTECSKNVILFNIHISKTEKILINECQYEKHAVKNSTFFSEILYTMVPYIECQDDTYVVFIGYMIPLLW